MRARGSPPALPLPLGAYARKAAGLVAWPAELLVARGGLLEGGQRAHFGKVEVDFFSGPAPTGNYYEPSVAMRADRETFGSSRRAHWFGL